MYRILIADDEEYVRDLLVKSIRGSSLEVEVTAVAGDGREALNLALKERPDIVITDISMPFMSGLDLIKGMQEAGLHSKSVVISGYDEFDYARQAISLGIKDYLLKPFLPKELNEVIEKMVQELDTQKTLQQNMSLLKEQVRNRADLARESALKSLLKGREFCEEQESEYAELGLELEGNCYAAGILHVTGEAWDFGSQEAVEEFLVLVRNGYIPEGIRIYAVSFDGVRLAVIWCGFRKHTEAFLKEIRFSLEKISVSLEKYYHMQIQCAVGRVYFTQKELETSYREAMTVWKGILTADHLIQFYGEEEKEDLTSVLKVREWKNQIRLSIQAGQCESAVSQLQGLIKCYAALSNKKKDWIGVSVGELVFAIRNDMEAAGYETEDKMLLAALEEKIRYGSLMDMKEMLESYVDSCCHVVLENSEETRASHVVRQIQLLLEQNIKNADIDLEWVSERVHFSSSYVRQIFKQHTGEGFGEYLIRKRMEQAGRLLQKTDLRIQEIAGECGYDNQRYFASSFKKFYGCTPTEFKKVVEEEGLY